MLVLELITFSFFLVLISFLFWASYVSKIENEVLASKKIFLFAFLLILLVVFIFVLQNEIIFTLSPVVIGITILFGVFLMLPLSKVKHYLFPIPKIRIDERDTMFSRNELKVGSEDYIDYYKRKPEHLELDINFRKFAGLLNNNSSMYNAFNYASSKASFGTVDALYNEVDGETSPKKIKVDKDKLTAYLKAWSVKLGALDCGITQLKDYHLYSYGGRKERRNIKYSKNHEFAIAFTVEMDKQMVDTAPKAGIVMESAQQYLEAGIIAVQIAKFIRNLGYDARAHIDGNYEVVCPLVARDAGLGDIGRMGLLMTPKYGPRVRIGVITTNIPLEIDIPKPDFSIIDFCNICKKCAESCPSQAISFNPQKEINGVERWQINQEACFTLWCKLGTDCGRCVSVCPYSHENNALHNLVRFGIKNNYVFRRVALKMDDVFYGRKPKSKDIPKYLKI